MSFVLMGLTAALLSWLAAGWVRTPRQRSLVSAAAFAALAAPVVWVGHGIGVAPSLFWIVGTLASPADVLEGAPASFAAPAIGMAATFFVVLMLAERVHGRSIRARVADSWRAFGSADECIAWLLSLRPSTDTALGAIVQNGQRETLTCVLGSPSTTYVYRPVIGNVASHSRGPAAAPDLVYDLLGTREMAPGSRTVPGETLGAVLADFLKRGGRSPLIEWDTPR